jgi:hypothetical protein
VAALEEAQYGTPAPFEEEDTSIEEYEIPGMKRGTKVPILRVKGIEYTTRGGGGLYLGVSLTTLDQRLNELAKQGMYKPRKLRPGRGIYIPIELLNEIKKDLYK